MFRNIPCVLLALCIALFFLDPWMPLQIKEVAYGFSLSLKSAVVLILPFLIFMLLFKTIAQLAHNGTKMVMFILACVCISNFFSTMISYQIGSAVYQLGLSMPAMNTINELSARWVFQFPKLIANDQAMFAGIILGILVPMASSAWSSKIIAYFEKWIPLLLKLLSAVIPLFIAGFVVKLIHDNVVETIFYQYSWIFLIVAVAFYGYIACIYLAANSFHVSNALKHVKTMLPAAVAGFSTMSSAAAMPLTILGTQKNSENSPLANLAIPVTVNIHMIGDCFAIPIFAFAIMKNFGVEEPSFSHYFFFVLYFVMAKFSAAAIPGGGIIVMLPILESQLGFTGEMSSFITALYILFDPVITSANVLGNGGFAIALTKLHSLVTKENVIAT